MHVSDDNRPRYQPKTPSPGQEKAIASLLERLAASRKDEASSSELEEPASSEAA